ncbi:MAG: nucleotidyl transferase AbiEii/AbiGii toxin family protein [Myxococcaceae bacterium]|nr:nucleotidyl transferase AbiEii/AbiGii toxin family protein [Myxococcaceae bacterium]
MFLTGGAALAGFYFGHRGTEDLDLFSAPGLDLSEVDRSLQHAAEECSATLERVSTDPEFRRRLARRGDETCVVDLVIDRATFIEPNKARFGEVRVDTLREIAANKVCTLLSRSELKDLVDLRELLNAGLSLEQALRDAERKDASVEPSTLAWILEQVTISPRAALPGGVSAEALEAFRKDLVQRLRTISFQWVRL